MSSLCGRRSQTFLHITISPPAAIDVDSLPDYAVPVSGDEDVESHNHKLAPVLTREKVHDWKIKPHLKHAVIHVLDRCLHAFADTDHDLGHITVGEYSITTRDALVINEK